MGHVADREIVPGLVLRMDPVAIGGASIRVHRCEPTEGIHYFVCLTRADASSTWTPLLSRDGQSPIRMKVHQDEKRGHLSFVERTTYVSLGQVWSLDNAVVIRVAKTCDQSLPRSRNRVVVEVIDTVLSRNEVVFG